MKNRTSSAPRRQQSRARPRLLWSALAGLAAAIALTVFAGTVRHAALIKNAAHPIGDGQKLSPDSILASGFLGTWVIVTAAVFIAATVAASRRARRATQQAGGTPAARRAAVRGW